MRHRNPGRKLNRTSSHRTAMFANMTAALIKHEQIKTTLAQGEGASPGHGEARDAVAPRRRPICTRAVRRIAQVRDLVQVRKLFDVIGPRYAARPGGYTRVLKAGFRYRRQRRDGRSSSSSTATRTPRAWIPVRWPADEDAESEA